MIESMSNFVNLASSQGERVFRCGAFTSRSGTGEGSLLASNALVGVAQTLPFMSAICDADIESNVGATHVRSGVIFKAAKNSCSLSVRYDVPAEERTAEILRRAQNDR